MIFAYMTNMSIKPMFSSTSRLFFKLKNKAASVQTKP